MRYNKILEVKEDADRVYFAFFVDNKTPNIVGVPKANSSNMAIYAGTSFEALSIVDTEKAKYVLTELMKRALAVHPAAQLCNKETLRLIG